MYKISFFKFKSLGVLISNLKEKFRKDYRTQGSIKAFLSIFEDLPENPFCLSIGGGPMREHKLITNFNIEPFANVDIVGDAHALPFSNNSVDAIFCEAVIEHLINPSLAVKEMYRVLKYGKRAYICTPFMQSYHGYPYHYQNFTLLGHKTLAEKQGFKIIDSGTCAGPVNALVTLVLIFINEYSPSILKYPLKAFWILFGIFLKPMDKIFNRKKNSHYMASTTYILVEKQLSKL